MGTLLYSWVRSTGSWERAGHRTVWAGLGLCVAAIAAGCGSDDGNKEPPVPDSGVIDFPTLDAGNEPPPPPPPPPPGDAGIAPDPDLPPDAGPGDPPDCPPPDLSVVPGTLAFYSFDADADPNLIEDATSNHPGTLYGAIARTPGREDCGLALDFAADVIMPEADNYVEVPHAPAWDLPEGSVDFWLRVASFPEGAAGLISRDAAYTERAGHLTLLLNSEGRIVARLQRRGTDNNERIFLCSEAALEPDTWTHVEFRWGPPHAQLLIDGAPSTYDGEVPTGLGGRDVIATCGGLWIEGIAGNENPWIIGAAAVSSPEGPATRLTHPFHHGAIDDVRIRGAAAVVPEPQVVDPTR